MHHVTGRFRRLPNVTKILARGANAIGGFGLVTLPFTIAYHSADLSRNLPRIAFTNLYHRDEGLGIDSQVAGIVHQAELASIDTVVATWAVW